MKTKQKNLKRLLIGEFSAKRLFRSVIFVYVCLCLWAFFFTDRLIFRPPAASYADTPSTIKLFSNKAVRISARYFPNPKATYTLLYSHGNAEDVGVLEPLLQTIQDAGFAVFAYDYQGYGTSEGIPSEGNAYQDIEAAYNYLTQSLQIPASQIILYGRSVGGGPAVDLASREPVAGLVVESTFISAFRVITFLPLLPFDKFDNLSKIKKVNCPVLVIHGKADEVIPFWHGEALFKAVKQPKQFLWVEQAGHNDVVEVAGERYRQALQTFVKQLRQPR